MLTPYIRHLVFTYLDNIVRRVNRRQPEASAVIEWLGDNIGLLELDGDELELPSTHRSDPPPSEKVWKTASSVRCG